MILGGEQPVALPTMRWYDNEAFKTYITALKDDYDKNLEEQKDFLDKYIDMAATDKDREYMANLVINPIVNFVKNNPDAIRSVEGRMMMRQLRNSIDPEAIGKIKGTAKMADTYRKALAEMIAKGTYSDDMQKVMGAYLNDWDSTKQGAFTQAAPYALDNILKLLSPTIESLRKAYRYNDALTKEKHDGYRYSTVSDQQIYDSLNGDYVDLMLMPSMQYHLKKYIKSHPNATEEDFKKDLFKQVRGQLEEKTEKDELYFNNLNFRQKVYLEDLNHKHAQQRAREQNEQKSGSSNYPLISSRLAYSSNEKFNNSSMPGLNTGYFVNYFSALAKTAKNSNDKAKYQQYAKEWSVYNNKSEKEQVAFLRKYGYLDKNGNFTKKYVKYLADVTKTGGDASGYTTGKKGNLITLTNSTLTAKNALSFYKRDATSVGNETVMPALHNKFVKQKNGFYQFNFNGNGRLSVVDAMDVQGVRRSGKNIYDLANRWLTKNEISGNVYDTSNVLQRTGGNNITFSNVGVTVELSKMKGLCDYLRNHGVTGYDRDILAKLGMVVVDSRGRTKTISRDATDLKGKHSSSTSSTREGNLFVKIPASFSLHGTDEITDFNNRYIKDNVSGKNSYVEFPNSYDASEDVKRAR